MQQLEQQVSMIGLKPVIIYPSEAQVGKEYLMTIDVELAEPQEEWPYPEEEYEILFQLNLRPYFSYQTPGKHEPMIVLHRFGGTYGAAEFLLTANNITVPRGEISITLLNTVGLPIANFELPCEVKENINDTLESVTINITQSQELDNYSPLPAASSATETTNNIKSDSDSFISQYEYEYDITKQETLRKLLNAQGWQIQQTGKRDRISPLNSFINNGNLWLRIAPSLPVGIIHRQHEYETVDEAIRYGNQIVSILAIPFFYIVTLDQEIIELDFLSSSSPSSTIRSALPEREELQQRWFSALQLANKKSIAVLTYPYHSTKVPRFYQEAAINQAVIAVLQAKQNIRSKRILITMATGTGKTLVAFQILWKLKRTYTVRNVLFLADRSYLLDQAQYNAFSPFGEAISRGTGKIDTTHDMIFGTYQWLTASEKDIPRYQEYPPDYFDIIIIDECHRGSAGEDSQWRSVLEHFAHAIQIGLTATPLATQNVQTDLYFGASIYTYSLSQGIRDGFLAPYDVLRVIIGRQNDDDYLADSILDTNELVEVLDPALVMETSRNLRYYTQAIAQHLAIYLQKTDTRAKTIVFCVDNNHAQQMRDALENTCASWAKPGDIVRIVDDDGSEGRRALSEFCTPREHRPTIVTTSRLLATGVDVPTCTNIVLARGVGSLVEFKQIIGRGTRLYQPEKTKFTILDYAGAIKHFFDPDFDGEPESITSETLLSPDGLYPSQSLYPDSKLYPESELQYHTPSMIAESPAIYEHTDIDSAHNRPIFSNTEADNPLENITAETEITNGSSQDIIEALPLHNIDKPSEQETITLQREDGTKFVVRREIYYILDTDGKTLLSASINMLINLVIETAQTPEDLTILWQSSAQQQKIQEQLEHAQISINALTIEFAMTDTDPLDILLCIVFHIPAITRRHRVEYLKQLHEDFFQRFEKNPLAQQIIDTILDAYTAYNIDVSDVGQLSVTPLSQLGTRLELARALSQNPPQNKNAAALLRELRQLLYSFFKNDSDYHIIH